MAGIQVRDRRGLARLLREHVSPQFATQEDAAARLGISQAHYSRLVRGKAPAALTRRTFERLRDVLPGDAWRQLTTVVLEPEQAAILASYQRWLDRTLDLYDVEPLMVEDALQLKDLEAVQRRAASRRDLTTLERWHACRAVLAWLQNREPYRSELGSFRRVVRNAGWALDNPRVGLALFRVAEPLAAATATEGVEVSVQELHVSAKLLGYLKAALKRELILLQRAPTIARAQARAAEILELQQRARSSARRAKKR